MNVLVTAGGTIAPIDDVRHVANFSTGRFGASIAEALLRRGADVTYLHTPAALQPFARLARLDLDADLDAELARLAALRAEWDGVRGRCHFVPVRSGTVAEYAERVGSILASRMIDLAFLAMAASDYAPERIAGKLSSDAPELTIRCQRVPKVIDSVKGISPRTFLVGFKLLSGVGIERLVEVAGESNRRTGADLTVANLLETVQAGRHQVHLVREGRPVEALGPAEDLADLLVGRTLSMLAEFRTAGRGRGPS